MQREKQPRVSRLIGNMVRCSSAVSPVYVQSLVFREEKEVNWLEDLKI